MHEINLLLDFYSSSLYSQFQRLVKPLIDSYPLDLFGYIINTPEGHFTHLGHNTEVSNTYHSNLCFVRSPFHSHPDNFYHHQIIITGDWNNNFFHDAQAIVKEKHGVHNFLVICRKIKGNAHLFYYSSTSEKTPLNSIFVNNLSAFNSYSDYFLEEWEAYQNKTESFFVDIQKFSNNIYFDNPIKNTDSFKDDQRKGVFLNKIGKLEMPPKKVLSKQELACVKLLLVGHNCRTIGEQMNLSQRTVEYYLDSVKNKLSCYSNKDLLILIRSYETHGLIDLLSNKNGSSRELG